MAYNYDPSKLKNTYEQRTYNLRDGGNFAPSYRELANKGKNYTEYDGWTRQNGVSDSPINEGLWNEDLNSRGLSGSWTDGSGRTINDLGAYLQKKSLQADGSDFSGYQTQTNNALSNLANQNADYQALLKDPSKINQTAGYQFAVDQGNQAINRSAAAKGMGNSGGVLAELARYGQGMASQEYGKQLGYMNQGIQNQGNSANMLASMMHNAQSFGVNSGYYDDLNPQKFQQGGGGARPVQQSSISVTKPVQYDQPMTDFQRAAINDFNEQVARSNATPSAFDWHPPAYVAPTKI